MTATSVIGNRGRPVRTCGCALRSQGFSLVELLVVVTIMVMLASIFPLALEHMVPARKLAAVTQKLVGTLRDLQSMALATGRSVSLIVANERYATRDGNGVEKTVDLPANMTLQLRDDVSGRALPDLTFFPDGSSTGGRFEMRYEDKVRSVVVTCLMGRVRDAR